MTEPNHTPPALADQPMLPYGTWVATQPAIDRPPYSGSMTWVPADPNDTQTRGPLRDQVHDTGTWQMGPGQSAVWFPAPSDDNEE